MNRLFLFIIVLAGFGCSLRKVSSVGTDVKSFTYNKVKIVYDDGTEVNSFKGKIAITRDSLISFKIYGSLGVEVLNGRYDSIFTLKSQFLTGEDFDLPLMVKRDFGFTLNRNMLQYFFTFDADLLLNEINRFKNSDVTCQVEHRRAENIISVLNANNGYKYQIWLPVKSDVPAVSYIYFDLAGKAGKLKFEFLSKQI